MPDEQDTTSSRSYRREIASRERRIDGVHQTIRTTSSYASVDEVIISSRDGQVNVFIGDAPRDRPIPLRGARIDLTPAEAAHVAGLLLAAAAEARG